jgi:hypothetical protein
MMDIIQNFDIHLNFILPRDLGYSRRVLLVLSKGPNRIGIFLSSPEEETRSYFRKLLFWLNRIPDDGQSLETQ